MTSVYPVLVEASGNQAFIFGSNRMRQAAGASELLRQVGTKLILEAAAELWSNAGVPSYDSNPLKLRRNLLEGRRIGNGPVEVVVATSGKALLLTEDADLGKQLITKVTGRALTEMPGLDVVGVVGSELTDDAYVEVLVELESELGRVRSRRSGPMLRFAAPSVARRSRSSHWPAESFEKKYRETARVDLEQRKAWKPWRERLARLVGSGYTIPDDIEELDEWLAGPDGAGVRWIAVVHADGNDIGSLFRSLNKEINTWREYVDRYRLLSLALDYATERAFLDALNSIALGSTSDGGAESTTDRADKGIGEDELFLPVFPLLLGGDDFTVIVDGRSGLEFTKAYLEAFETRSKESFGGEVPELDGVLPEAARRAELSKDGLTAAAGVAFVKPHFPFHTAYDLAKDLLSSAKRAKIEAPGHSSIDFHVLYDTARVDLEDLRARLSVDNGNTSLTAKPCVLGDDLPVGWAEDHSYSGLVDWMAALVATNEDGSRQIPATQAHRLRQVLDQGVTSADTVLASMRHRYQALEDLTEETESLFFGPVGDKRTHLLDAMEAVEVER